jgi:hypothetical protein
LNKDTVVAPPVIEELMPIISGESNADEKVVSPLSPKEPRSPKLSRWEVDALKKQAKESETKMMEMRTSHRNVILKAILGRFIVISYYLSF